MTMLRTLADWRTARRTARELSRLGDRELHDAGIPRWRIEEIAKGAPIDPRQVM